MGGARTNVRTEFRADAAIWGTVEIVLQFLHLTCLLPSFTDMLY